MVNRRSASLMGRPHLWPGLSGNCPNLRSDLDFTPLALHLEKRQ